jgi:hypothetical protein
MARRAFLWLARGDNSFHVMLWTCLPPLLALTLTGFF